MQIDLIYEHYAVCPLDGVAAVMGIQLGHPVRYVSYHAERSPIPVTQLVERERDRCIATYFDAEVITLDIKEDVHVICLDDASQTFLSGTAHCLQLGNGLALFEAAGRSSFATIA